MKDVVDYLFALSDDELVMYWRAFKEYPTHDRNQRRRLHAALARLRLKEAPKQLGDLRRKKRAA